MDSSGAQHAREAENSYPAIYKVQLWVRICVVGLAVVPVSLLFAAISGAIHTKSDGLAYSLIALFAALAVYGVAWAFTAQVTICADRFEQRKPFVHRVLLVAEIAGRRYTKGPGAFYPLELSLKAMGHAVIEAADGAQALSVLAEQTVDLVLTDLRMPTVDGIALLAAMKEQGIEVPVIVMTAYGTIDTAVAAMKLGAVDYIIRPFEMETVEMAVARALALVTIQRENRFLREEMSRGWGEFIGTSPAMQALYEIIQQAAPTRSSIFIVGETGTGKELVARAIHQASGRTGLFVPINCAAIPADLLESELFGHVKGAFTGALRDRVGKCELAHGGTLFLDEITEMPANLQAKLLRVLQEGRIERLGTNASIAVDLRVVAATNRDPQLAVDDGSLRRDLYFRLNVVRIDVPRLRDRVEDIGLLARHFLHKHASELGRQTPSLGAPALQRLESYDWPGNVLELENLMERATVLCRGNDITVANLPAELSPAPAAERAPVEQPTLEGPLDLKERVETLERQLIAAALKQSDNSKAGAARLLGVSERTLWYKLKAYQM